jgi:putative tricarboxylic transport membrane protein
MSGFDPAPGRRPDGAAFIIAAVLAAGGGLLIWQGSILPNKGGYAGIGSGAMPLFVGAVLLLLALGHLVQGLRRAAPSLPRQKPLPILLIVGGLLLQLLLLKPLGFSIASGILFACTAAAFGKRNFALSLPVGIVFALVIYGLFDGLMKLNLPSGFLETLIFGG